MSNLIERLRGETVPPDSERQDDTVRRDPMGPLPWAAGCPVPLGALEERGRVEPIGRVSDDRHPQALTTIETRGIVAGTGDERLVMERSGVGVQVFAEGRDAYVKVIVVPSPISYSDATVACTRVDAAHVVERVGLACDLACDLAWQLIRLREGGWMLDPFAQMSGVLVRAPEPGEAVVARREARRRPHDTRARGYLGVSWGRRGRRSKARMQQLIEALTALPDAPPPDGPESPLHAIDAHADDLIAITRERADAALVDEVVRADPQLDAEATLAAIDTLRASGRGEPALADIP